MPEFAADSARKLLMPILSSQFARAIFFILLAIFLFDLQGLIVKYLGGRYPVQQLASFRNIFGLIPSLMVLLLSSDWHQNGRKLLIRPWRLGLLRGIFIAFAQFCFYLSITKMEFATATTLTYISPVVITLLSIPLLGHQVGRWRWAAVILGFVGVVVIMQPGSELFTVYALLPVGAAFGYSLSTVVVQKFDPSIPTALINLYATVGAIVGAFSILLFTTSYVPVETIYDWYWLVAMGLVGGFAVLALITAYRLAKPSSLSPFEYFGIPFAFILGWLFFDEAPIDRLLPGVFFIVGGGLLIAWRERKNSKMLSSTAID